MHCKEEGGGHSGSEHVRKFCRSARLDPRDLKAQPDRRDRPDPRAAPERRRRTECPESRACRASPDPWDAPDARDPVEHPDNPADSFRCPDPRDLPDRLDLPESKGGLRGFVIFVCLGNLSKKWRSKYISRFLQTQGTARTRRTVLRRPTRTSWRCRQTWSRGSSRRIRKFMYIKHRVFNESI